MTHRGPFQPLPFCDSVTQRLRVRGAQPLKARWSAPVSTTGPSCIPSTDCTPPPVSLSKGRDGN